MQQTLIYLLLSHLAFAEPPEETETLPSPDAEESEETKESEESTDSEETERTSDTPEETTTKSSLLAKPTDNKDTPTDDPVSPVPSTEQQEFTLIFSGLDQQVAISRTTAASDREVESILPKTFTDLTYGKLPSMVEGGTLSSCSSGPMSMSRIRMLQQKPENELTYYQLDKAEQHLTAAVDGIVCLQDTVEIDIIVRTFYLSGILHHTLNNKELAAEHFMRAIALQPNLQWDNYFAPDALPLFEETKKSFANQKEHSFNVLPKRIQSNVWVNGVPIAEGEDVRIPSGTNLIQVLGRDLDTYLISVEEEAESATLFIPSGVPDTANTWIVESEQRNELELILPQLLEEESVVYLHNNGDVWSNVVGTPNWQQLEVPRWANNNLMSKKQIGRTMMWSGVGISAVCGGISTIKYLQAYSYANTAKETDSFAIFDENRTKYNSIDDNYAYWASGTLVGLGLTGVGFYLSF